MLLAVGDSIVNRQILLDSLQETPDQHLQLKYTF